MMIAFTCSGPGEGGEIARETGATFIECRPGDRAGTDKAVARALELGEGRLDLLVTNPALTCKGPIEAMTDAAFRELLELNLTAAFRVARASFEPMGERGAGSMVHVASDAGIRAVHHAAAYSVASAGVIAVAELFGAEGAPRGVRSNAVCPDDVDSDTGSSYRADTAADVASVVAWLACDQSKHVNGATLRIDGARGAAMVADTRG
jgi:NAD(P)-dependent dehydrogenase (short-subunit alcohol dehydrogenase family)